MAQALKMMGEGQLPNLKGTLYTVPVGKTAVVKTLSFVNVSGGTVTINLYVKPGATSRQIVEKGYSLAAGKGLFIDGTSIILEAGDLIEGDASAVTSVDYYLGGVEFD